MKDPKNLSLLTLRRTRVLSRKYDSLYISPFTSKVIQRCRVGTLTWISFFRSRGINYAPCAMRPGQGSGSCSILDGWVGGTNGYCFQSSGPLGPITNCNGSMQEIRIAAGGGMIMIDGVEG